MTPIPVSLPPYRPEPRCQKCGFDKASTKYHPFTQQVAGGMHPSCPWTCELHWVIGLTEHLVRVCQRCGYEWAEAVLKD